MAKAKEKPVLRPEDWEFPELPVPEKGVDPCKPGVYDVTPPKDLLFKHCKWEGPGHEVWTVEVWRSHGFPGEYEVRYGWAR